MPFTISTIVFLLDNNNSNHYVRAFSIQKGTKTTALLRINTSSSFTHQLSAKKRRKDNDQDINQMFDWYDKVDSSSATPDDIFWEEMERQKLLNQVGGGATGDSYEINNGNGNGSSSSSSSSTNGNSMPYGDVSTVLNGGNANANGGANSGSMRNTPPKSADAILASFAMNMVNDNWLDAGKAGHEDNANYEWDEEEQRAQVDAAWDAMYGNDEDNCNDNTAVSATTEDAASEFAFSFDTDDDVPSAEEAEEERQFLKRLDSITIKSTSFDNVRKNPANLAALNRDPDYEEGMDRLWIGAIDQPSVHNLKGMFKPFGVEIAENFGDWEYGSKKDQQYSIEDLASFKAREVYKATGLPCISSQSTWEVEPSVMAGTGMSPRALSGYRFNDIDDRIDMVVEALKPISDPSRKTRFRSCVCFYDGQMELYAYGEVEVDLLFCTSLKCYISLSSAITEISNVLKTTFDFEYQKWLKSKAHEAFVGYRGARIKLRDRVLKDGRVLPNDIIDVSKFMDSMVDVDLMGECGIELAQHFLETKATKILTVATTGLIIAMPMASELQVPVVYARKERSLVMADTFQAAYSSNTVGSNRMLYVAKSHIDPDDRVLIVDDFLSAGSSQEALLRIVSDAGATPVGVAVLIEKVYESGRKSLSGFNVPVHSMVSVASVRDGVITLVEEEGFQEEEIPIVEKNMKEKKSEKTTATAAVKDKKGVMEMDDDVESEEH